MTSTSYDNKYESFVKFLKIYKHILEYMSNFYGIQAMYFSNSCYLQSIRRKWDDFTDSIEFVVENM